MTTATHTTDITLLEAAWTVRNAGLWAEQLSKKADLLYSIKRKFEREDYNIDNNEHSMLFEIIQLQITDLKCKIQWYEKQEDKLKYATYLKNASDALTQLKDLRHKLIPKGENKNELQQHTESKQVLSDTTGADTSGTDSVPTADVYPTNTTANTATSPTA